MSFLALITILKDSALNWYCFFISGLPATEARNMKTHKGCHSHQAG